MFELFEIFRNAKMEKEALIKRIYPVCVEELNLKSPAITPTVPSVLGK